MLGNWNEQTQSPLLSTLPVEMILDIADQTTSAADAVSLALTCKDLFSILSKYSIKRLDTHSREMLLTNLERDISWVVYCPFARRLLSFESRENIFYYPAAHFFHQTYNTLSLSHPFSICQDKNPCISFLETRLVRNRHLFGPTHGIPLSCLSRTTTQFSNCLFMKTQRRIFLDISRTAKWIGENLFLSSTFIVRVMGVKTVGLVISRDSLMDFLCETHLGSPCYHCKLYYGVAHFPHGVHDPSFKEAGARLSENSAYEGRGACSVCETDWDVSISWLKHSLVFKIVKYHDLGCCSLPPDPKWVRLLEPRVDEVGRSLPRETRHGYVRHRWINNG